MNSLTASLAFNRFLGGPFRTLFKVQSFSDSSLEDGSVLSDLESESSRELESSAGCEEVPEDVSDLDSVDVSVTDAGRSVRCVDAAVVWNRWADVI